LKWGYGNESTFTTPEEALWFQPITIVSASIDAAREVADAGGTTIKLVDAALVEADDYWNDYVLAIITTTDGLAPQGEVEMVRDFTAGDDTLHFDAMTAATEAGDTYELRSFVLVDRAVYLYTADGGAVGSLDDAELTEADDYWNNTVLYIVSTTDGLAPQGEFALVEDFVAGTDTLDFPTFPLSAAPEADDTYYLRNDGHVTWGINSSITITYGEMISYESTTATSATEVGFVMQESPLPVTWFASGGNVAALPLYDAFNTVATQTGIAIQTIYFLLIIGLALAVALFLMMFTRSAMLGFLGMVIVLFIGSSQTIIPMWIPFAIIVTGVGIMYLYKQVSY